MKNLHLSTVGHTTTWSSSSNNLFKTSLSNKNRIYRVPTVPRTATKNSP
uniref:Uncharacterized protein n=1 Tax=Arundo donax TaxID=35708 RepID=A0A0A9FX59_ARUDO